MPSATRGSTPSRSIEQPHRQRVEHPGGSLLDAPHLHGRGVVRDRVALPAVRRQRSAKATGGSSTQWTGDVQPITYNAGRPVSVTLRLPIDRRNGIKADTGIFVQDRWTMGRVTLNLGLRYDWFIGETRESEVLAEPASTSAADVRQV